jgi:hypothetical protein
VKKSKKARAAKPAKNKADIPAEPWIPMRNGIAIISVTSVLMAILTGITAIPAKGWFEGILWSLGFGAFIWAIFFLLISVNRLLKR